MKTTKIMKAAKSLKQTINRFYSSHEEAVETAKAIGITILTFIVYFA